jgi:hypothetical protein
MMTSKKALVPFALARWFGPALAQTAGYLARCLPNFYTSERIHLHQLAVCASANPGNFAKHATYLTCINFGRLGAIAASSGYRLENVSLAERMLRPIRSTRQRLDRSDTTQAAVNDNKARLRLNRRGAAET